MTLVYDDGRRAIGIELEKKWCDVAISRLAQGSLFAYALTQEEKANETV